MTPMTPLTAMTVTRPAGRPAGGGGDLRPSAVVAAPAPAAAPNEPKVTVHHLARQALLYIRQSSPTQVQRHPESARRQYALAERAQRLGWTAEQVVVIDEDQGKSGAGSAAAHEREGFARLVSAVGLGGVGLVLVLEVSRLARNSAEWYRLLELAALTGTLIADDDAVYDPRQFNDRLVLGLRGTVSEVELHCIQARLQGARLSKARRGELALPLPVGYVRGRDGQIEVDPDQEVQAALRTIFAQFECAGTATAVLRFFRDHGLRVPRRRHGGPNPGELVWAKPTYQAVHLVLSNPVYAGAFVYSRRQRDGERSGVPGALGLGPPGPRRRFALDTLEVLVGDHHAAYVSWDRYLANRARLRDNARQFATSRGAPQPGSALLQGLAVCGRCGCRMQVHYSLSSPSYICRTRHKRYGEPICQTLSIAHVDHAVEETFLAVIRPATVEALLVLSDELDRERAQVERQWQLRLERARYDAERARRQYDQCEPENRLVARELETRWNARLRALADLEDEYRREQDRGLSPLTDAERGLLRSLVGDVPTLWQAAETTVEDRKALVRCLVREAVLTRDDAAKGAGGVTTLRVGWKSGAWTEMPVRRPSTADHARTAAALLARIRASAAQVPDERIAAQLNAEGVTTRQGLPWTALRVERIRRSHRIYTKCPAMPTRLPVAGRPRGDGLMSVGAAAARLGVAPSALSHWRKWGFLYAEQRGPGAPLWVRLTPEDLARLDGTLAAQGHGRWRLQEARRALGVSPEQLWGVARRGEVIAYRARVADHWEWRVSPAAADAPAPAGERATLM
jgi:DNA invertase Pin-like site-specific DNA recombinase